MTGWRGDLIREVANERWFPMKGSLRLGTFFRIPVHIHWTFLLLLGFVAVSRFIASSSIAVALAGVVFVASVFVFVVLHEYGHALTARRFGIETRDVTLLPIGGVARLDRMPDDPKQELWVALAGPAVNLAIAGLLAIWLFLAGPGSFLGSLLAQMLTVNLVLVLFNMLPAFPMDGGRVLRALLARKYGLRRATDTAAKIGRGMALLFGVAGLFWSPMLVMVAVFVWFGAGQEEKIVRARAAYNGSPLQVEILGGQEPRVRGRYYRVGPWVIYREEWVEGDYTPSGSNR